MSVRDARPGDGAALAALHEEMGACEIDRELRDAPADVLALVAQVDGGYLAR